MYSTLPSSRECPARPVLSLQGLTSPDHPILRGRRLRIPASIILSFSASISTPYTTQDQPTLTLSLSLPSLPLSLCLQAPTPPTPSILPSASSRVPSHA